MSLNQGSLDVSRQLLKLDTLEVDTINEKTTDQGINIDSLIIKDEGINFPSDDKRFFSDSGLINVRNIAETVLGEMRLNNVYIDNLLLTDAIQERVENAGVMIDGSLIKDRVLKIDDIVEDTPNLGITVDGTLIKDKILTIDQIIEQTSNAGINIDGLVIKDVGINFVTDNVRIRSIASKLEIRNVANSIYKNLKGDTVEGNVAVKSDSIVEKTSGAGVTIDNVVLKDGIVSAIMSMSVVDPPASTIDPIDTYYPDINGEELVAEGAHTTINFVLPPVSGTESIVSVSEVKLRFQVKIGGAWLNKSLITVDNSSGFNNLVWDDASPSIAGAEGFNIVWRLTLDEIGSGGDAYELGSFAPSGIASIDLL